MQFGNNALARTWQMENLGGTRVWYEADYNYEDDGCECWEYHCKKRLPCGKLRISVKAQLMSVHFSEELYGRYHPECLWRSFAYPRFANKRIWSLIQISGYIQPDDKERLKRLIRPGLPLPLRNRTF
jgi:hypothetical protein